ncbi:major facilitator superfamily domain-containing protein [Powellomyces hirtus]|nr:major facilitator superfamily domain-containing protein [Powellomyces hirtus]
MSPKPLPLDIYGRARQLRLFSLSRPHMLSFHISWLSFFAAFTCWFALNPLLKSTIAPDIGLTARQVSSTDVANVGSTIFFRLVVGVLTDKFGPRMSMAFILGLGPIPLLCVGFVKNVAQLAIARTFVGLLGAAFVPCQYWTTAFFSESVVGTANAVAGGWGNMGGGATFLLMPNIFNGFVSAGLTKHQAWRVALLVPAAFCWVCALICIFVAPNRPAAALPQTQQHRDESNATVVHYEMPATATSTAPTGTSEINRSNLSLDTKPHDDSPTDKSKPDRAVSAYTLRNMSSYLRALLSPPVLILMLHYACSFGVELSVDSVIGSYLQTHFGLGQTLAGNIGSIFGLMNLFSRATGGILSDVMQRRFGMRGRILIQLILLVLNGVCLILFSFTGNLASAVVALIFFSFFTESACGSTFGVVPYVAKTGMGMASGLVGAGGTAGGALFNVLFHHYVDTPEIGFRIMGAIVIGAGLSSFMLTVGGHGLLTRRP